VDLIKYLDDAAAQQHTEDLSPTSSPRAVAGGFASPAPPQDTRRWSGVLGSAAPLAPQFEEGFEAVDSADLPSGSVLATGVKDEEVARRGWFVSWGGAQQ